MYRERKSGVTFRLVGFKKLSFMLKSDYCRLEVALLSGVEVLSLWNSFGLGSVIFSLIVVSFVIKNCA